MRFNLPQVCYFRYLLHSGYRRHSNQQQVGIVKLPPISAPNVTPMERRKASFSSLDWQEFASTRCVGQSRKYCDLPTTGIQPFEITLTTCFVKPLSKLKPQPTC